MKQLDLEDYIREKRLEKKKPPWVNSSYQPIKRGDLVEYNPSGTPRAVGLVLRVFQANVYESNSCEILEKSGNTITVHTKWVRKIT